MVFHTEQVVATARASTPGAPAAVRVEQLTRTYGTDRQRVTALAGVDAEYVVEEEGRRVGSVELLTACGRVLLKRFDGRPGVEPDDARAL